MITEIAALLNQHYTTGRLHNSYLINTDDLKLGLDSLMTFIKDVLKTDSLDNHGDYFFVQRTDASSKAITIEHIRALQQFLYQTSVITGKKMAIIYVAEQMNLNAANACLKMLEDTPTNSHLFLLTSQIQNIIPTIYSRCFRLSYHYNKRYSFKLDDAFIQPLLNTASASEKIQFINSFANKDKDLWHKFTTYLQEFLVALHKHSLGIQDNLSPIKQNMLLQFTSLTPHSLHNKYDRIKTLTEQTNALDLDHRVSVALIMHALHS